MSLTISEVAERTGLSPDTLRYYEKAGLIDRLERNSGGHRRYAAADMDWIAFLLRLRQTGMSIADMQRFAELRRGGEATVADRLELLERHRSRLDQHMQALAASARALDDKIDHYRRSLKR